MTLVVNLQRSSYDGYIGRPRAREPWRWGNPFSHRGYGLVRVASLEDSLLNYAAWLRGEVQVRGLTPPTLEEIRQHLKGRRLGCFCKPKSWSLVVHRGMRKLFRMQYEPCSGQCYAASEVLSLQGMSVGQIKEVMDAMVAMHEPACGNRNVCLGLDLDEESGVFVGSFMHYGRLELVAGPTPLKTLLRLETLVWRHIQSEEWQVELASVPGLGHEVCEHGHDEDLRIFSLEHSGLAGKELTLVRETCM